MKSADVVPITFAQEMSGRAVYGCSVLSQATRTGPAGFANFLKGPCLAASDNLALVSVEDELGALLDAYKSKRLGFAFVHESGNPMKGCIVSMADVLSLFASGAIGTQMTVEDVASPMFSMPGDTPLGDALKVMYRHSYRRIFLTGEESCVFDREIMDHVFSPTVLEGTDPEQRCKDALGESLGAIGKTTPDAISGRTGLGNAASKLLSSKGGCLVVDGEKVVTPWDAVMKPWLAGELKIV